MTYIHMPRGLRAGDKLTEVHLDGAHDPANRKDPLYREIFVPPDSSKIFHGYAYLGNYLNFRQTNSGSQPMAQVGDLLFLRKLPVNAFLLDVRHYLYPEKIINYNKLTKDTFNLLQFGIGPNDGSGPFDYHQVYLASGKDASDFVADCNRPRTSMFYWSYSYRYSFMVPIKSWLPPNYSEKDAELCCKIVEDDPGNKYEGHIWYTWCEP